jgi:hypothetical protein
VKLTWKHFWTLKFSKSSMLITFLLATAKSVPKRGWNLTLLPPAWNSFLYKSLYSFCDLWWLKDEYCKTNLKLINHDTSIEIPYFNYILVIGRAKNSFWWVEVQWSYCPIMSNKIEHWSLKLYKMHYETSKHNELILKLQRKD